METAEKLEVQELDTETADNADTGEEVIPETDKIPNGDELVLQIEGESPAPEEDSSVIRQLRKTYRETAEENKKLRLQLESLSDSRGTELGPKPSIDDYLDDPDKFEPALTDWIVRKQSVEVEKGKAEEKQIKLEEAWSKKLKLHALKKSELPFSNVEDAEAVAKQFLSDTQIGMIKDGATNSALLIHALGSNPAIVEKFSKIENPVQFAFTVGKWEEKVKTTTRRASTKPETKVVGQAPVSDDKTLERLRAEASKSGDNTKVIAYRQAQRQKNRISYV